MVSFSRRFTALVVAFLVATPALAAAKEAPGKKRRAQVVRMKPITAHPMRPNAVIEIRRRRMTLPTRGATGFAKRIGRRVAGSPF